jgi:hypothetical protein
MWIWLKFKGYIIAALAVVTGVLAIYFTGKRDGVNNEFNRQSDIDRQQSRKIQDAADRVRRAGRSDESAIERLRKHSKLRDD